ncbi:Histone deacetylase hda1 [Vermiconidia calcicola]|uniref:Histone deacetylase hda1 n=1 Tax=Vermiconidia calcicola TaxID=1690605 RepID=A0ACC3N445_9PEZI|nr:Histone deacetylase hda1 [Vermiconidia calcicola]
MDLEVSTDILMQDGDIVASTETQGQQSVSSTEMSFKAEPNDNEYAKAGPEPSRKLLGSPLKGGGLKRDTGMADWQPKSNQAIPRPPKFPPLPYASSQTGLVYDVRMRFHVETVSIEDDIHPEDPRRIHAIFESFVDAGLAWKKNTSGPSNDYYMGRIDARKVTKEEVCLVHTEEHWNWIQGLSAVPMEDLEELEQHPGTKMDSVYLSNMTPYCAALSAGGAIEACRAIMLGKVKNVFAVIRPPGHHAEREDAKGFCFFDNVSIATKVCQREFGERCRKILILDWDVHHGNGIQQANYDDPNVLYISLHLHERGRFYPEHSYRDRRGPYGDHLHCGDGAGLGRNVNIPWSKKGMGDADYVYAFQQVVMPIAIEFDPDLVIVAAGFDAAKGDMLGGCMVTPAGYAHMTHMLMSLAQGRVAVCLEGGYNLDSIARSATAVARTLMGEPPERLQELHPSITAVDDVKLVVRQQSRFWSSLYPKDISARLAGSLHGERMHDVVRRWQATTLWDEYEMSSLFVYKEQLSKSFENQVLATPNYTEARPLLVILHDPPEMIASPDPRTGKVELHNTWLTDIVKTYIDWAVKHDFAVIDVNLPTHVSDAEDNQIHQPEDSMEYRTREATQLLTYLWDNYIELNEATHVFLMGTNTGHGAIINFIKNNEERAQEQLTTAISFVKDVPLQSCRSATNDQFAQWYHASSLVFVEEDHNFFWLGDLTRKPKKRFGKVQKSPAGTISEMLIEHKEAVFNLLTAETADWRAARPHDEDEEMATARMPPVSNFAPSPRPGALPPLNPISMPPVGTFLSSNGTTARSLRGGSPLPPIGNFAPSPKPRSSRSPAR